MVANKHQNLTKCRGRGGTHRYENRNELLFAAVIGPQNLHVGDNTVRQPHCVPSLASIDRREQAKEDRGLIPEALKWSGVMRAKLPVPII